MPRKTIKRFLPDHLTIRNHKYLQIFGSLLHDPGLWHLSGRSVSAAVAIGLFVAFIPIPFQMVLAAGIAIFARANLVVSSSIVWVSNPFTMPPMLYFSYKVGAWILDTPVHKFTFSPTVEWLTTELYAIWQPFLLGCFLLGALSSLIGYVLIYNLWRMHVLARWQEKKAQWALRKSIKNSNK